MPINEFVCPKCGHKTETINAPVTRCIKCGSEMKKIVSAPAFRVYTKL